MENKKVNKVDAVGTARTLAESKGLISKKDAVKIMEDLGFDSKLYDDEVRKIARKERQAKAELKRVEKYNAYCNERITVCVGYGLSYALTTKVAVYTDDNGKATQLTYIDGLQVPAVLIPVTDEKTGRFKFVADIKGTLESNTLKGEAAILYKKRIAKAIRGIVSELNDSVACMDYIEYAHRVYTNVKQIEFSKVELSVAKAYGLLEECKQAKRIARACKVKKAMVASVEVGKATVENVA